MCILVPNYTCIFIYIPSVYTKACKIIRGFHAIRICIHSGERTDSADALLLPLILILKSSYSVLGCIGVDEWIEMFHSTSKRAGIGGAGVHEILMVCV